MLELLQPEAQSARQTAASGTLPLLFVRVSPPSPQNRNLKALNAAQLFSLSPAFRASCHQFFVMYFSTSA